LSVPFLSSRWIKLSTTAALAKPSSSALLPWNMFHLLDYVGSLAFVLASTKDKPAAAGSER
jgi:hypothetical protein